MENSRYKFRAWDKENNKMRQVVSIDLCPEFGGCWFWGKSYQGFDDGEHEADKDFLHWGKIGALMQCTGLIDKNGKEIFEGDILLCREMHDSNVFGHAWKNVWTKNNPGHSVAIPQVIKQNSPIDWDIPEDISYHPNWWEIIGNIHENHELLEANP